LSDLRKFSETERSIGLRVKHRLNFQENILLLLGGGLLLISFFLLVSTTGLNRSTQKFEYWFFLPFLTYLIIIASTKYFRLDKKRYYLQIIVFFTISIQLLILSTEVTLSDDIYRFILEGKMILEGLNPYKISLNEVPSSFTSEFLPLVNNGHITSPYPPLVVFLFTILVWIWEDPLLFRLVFSSSFILSIVLLDKLLIVDHRWKLVIFAWNPLFHLETGNGSHFEAVIVLFIIIALLNLERNKKVFASVMLLATFLVKYYSILIILIFWKHLGKKGQTIISIGMLGYVAWIFLDFSLISGLLKYVNEWYFNASIIWILTELTSSLFLAKIITGTVFIIIFVIIVKKANKYDNIPYNFTGFIIGLFLLFQPTFHPWYIFWLFPFILMEKDTVPWSWILLSGLIIFSYNVYVQFDTLNVWKESILVRIIEYLPFYSIYLYEKRFFLFEQIRWFKTLFRNRKRITPS